MRELGNAVVLASTLCGLTLACSPASPSPVDEVVDSNLAARGGKVRLPKLRSIRLSGTATASGGRIAQVVREIQRPDRSRLELTYQGTMSVFANDGEKGWQPSSGASLGKGSGGPSNTRRRRWRTDSTREAACATRHTAPAPSSTSREATTPAWQSLSTVLGRRRAERRVRRAPPLG